MSIVWKLLAVIASGLLLSLCYPTFDVDGLVWVWSLPLFTVLFLSAKKEPRTGMLRRFRSLPWGCFWLGYLSGLAFWLVNLHWLTAMSDVPGVTPVAANFSWIGMSIYLSLYFGIFAMIVGSVANPWRAKLVVAAAPQKSRVDQRIEEKKQAVAEKLNHLKPADKKFNFLSGLPTSLRIIRFALMHASLWVVLEWLRGWLFTGFTWNGLGVAFHNNGTIAQAADLVGVTGLSFLPILVASMMVQLGHRLIQETKAGKFTAHLEIAFTVGLVVLTFVYGVFRIAHFQEEDQVTVKAIILQENIKQDLKWGNDAQQALNYLGYANALEKALVDLKERSRRETIERAAKNSEGSAEHIELKPDIVILPESALTQNMLYVEGLNDIRLTDMDRDFLNLDMITGDFSLIFGSNLFQGEVIDDLVHPKSYYNDSYENYNSLAIATPLKREGEKRDLVFQAYGKAHLVPFGEYYPDIPFRGIIYPMLLGTDPPMNFSPGTSYDPLSITNTNGEKVGVIPAVCFEDTFGRVTRKFVRKGPQMIVNVTNDGWFGKSNAAIQHMANAKFRAIEIRRPMIRCANTGMSGVVNVLGGLTDPETGERQVIEDENGNIFIKDTLFAYVRVPKSGEVTLYAALGDWFVIFCAGLFTITLGLTVLKK